MSEPALKQLGRVNIVRMPTPVPRTRSRVEVAREMLGEADARIKWGYELLDLDAEFLAREEHARFGARVRAFLQDLDNALELLQAIEHFAPDGARDLYPRHQELADLRAQGKQWLALAGQ